MKTILHFNPLAFLIAWTMLLGTASFPTAKACDRASFSLDFVEFNGTTYTVHTTFTLGGGVTGPSQGAALSTIEFALASYSTSDDLISFWPNSLTSRETGCTVNGFIFTFQPPMVNMYFGPDPVSNVVFFQSSNNCEFTCVAATPLCGPMHTDTFHLSFVYNNLPDSMTMFGVEGAGNISMGCAQPFSGQQSWRKMTIDFTSLPVTWGKFEVREEGRQVYLDWETLSEQNNDSFEIMRSQEGENWTSIGRVPAKGASHTTQSYHFTDTSPLFGTSYYHVVQRDIQGSASATEIQSVSVPLPTGLALRAVGPVPARQELHLDLESDRKTEVLIQLLDLQGHLFKAQTFVMEAGSNAIALEVKELPRGCYLLLIQGKEETFRQKILLH